MCFLANGRFLTKFGHKSRHFLVEKSYRNDILLTNNIVLTELTFFDQISALQQRVFHDNFEKNDMRSPCF